jgi:glutamine synthetase
MNLFSAARTRREEEEQLPKETEMAIARLSTREIADRDLKDILSEPVELTGEFKEEDEFENLIKEINTK